MEVGKLVFKRELFRNELEREEQAFAEKAEAVLALSPELQRINIEGLAGPVTDEKLEAILSSMRDKVAHQKRWEKYRRESEGLIWKIEGTDYFAQFRGEENHAYIATLNSSNYEYDYDWELTKTHMKQLTELVKDEVDRLYQEQIADWTPMKAARSGSCDLSQHQKATFTNEDIVITDPCYISEEMDLLLKGRMTPKNFVATRTMFGDGQWSVLKGHPTQVAMEALHDEDCELIDSSHLLGKCAADSATIGVFSVSDILKDNYVNAEEYVARADLATVIKNFTGTVEVIYSEIGWLIWGKTHYIGIKGSGSQDFMVWLD